MTATVESQDIGAIDNRDALSERLFGALLSGIDTLTVYLGARLGYYRVIAEGGALTSQELALRTGTVERYAREWLEQQAVTGLLTVENPEADALNRRFSLPAGFDEVLLDPTSLSYLTPGVQALFACTQVLPLVENAFRNGGGVAYEAYGKDFLGGQAALNRPQFEHLLASEWFPAMPDIHARLQSSTPARIADIGMGAGWSSIAIARAYPNVIVDGFDIDGSSVSMARANAAAAGLEDRVRFYAHDAADPALAGHYDFACAFECIHDMSQPVPVLAAMRRLVGEHGSVLIADERVADRFAAPGDDIERFLYGWSVLHCLPVGMADQPSVATGTIMREETFRRYATDAGFHAVDVLPVEHPTFRFYRLKA